MLIIDVVRCAIRYHLWNLKNLKTPIELLLSRFLNCANGTKSRNASHMIQSIQKWILSKICERQSLKKLTVFLSFTWSILVYFDQYMPLGYSAT